MSIFTPFLIFVVIHTSCLAQMSSNLLYDFDNLPQYGLLNPAVQADTHFHIAVPVISGLRVQAGSSGITAYDIFKKDGTSISQNIKESVYKLTSNDFFYVEQHLDILYGGVKWGKNGYFSFGIYEEFDLYSSFPADASRFFYETTTISGKKYQLANYNLQTSLRGVYHIGYSKKWSDQWLVGARLKMYSSALHVQTKKTEGTFQTVPGTDNIYRHILSDLYFEVQTAGAVFEDESTYNDIDRRFIQNRVLFSGDKGFGFDIGFEYIIDKRRKLSMSLIDLGFVSHKKNIKNYRITGSYETEGLHIEFDPLNPINYWQELIDDVEANIIFKESDTGYTRFLPFKYYASYSYKFGTENRRDCNTISFDKTYINKIGTTLFLQPRLKRLLWSGGVFLDRKWNKFFSTRISYSADPINSTNIGVGMSLHIPKVNMYILTHNILALSNLSKAHSASLEFGLNINIESWGNRK